MGHERRSSRRGFPGKAAIIDRLKTADPHFARLLEQYDDLNRDIHRLEIALDPESEEETEELKRRRLFVKDQIAALLADAEA